MKRVVLLLLLVLAAGAAGLVIWRTMPRVAPDAARELPPATVTSGSRAIFTRHSGAPDGADGAIGAAALDALDRPGYRLDLKCERVHMVADRGVCLEGKGGFALEYAAVLFDRTFTRVTELPLAGLPSRVQVSPGGRYAGVTVFVSGHSYLDAGFSTRTSILDLASRQWLIEDLETLSVRRDGRPFRATDFNFWGVTFARDEHTFYATLSSGGTTFLIRGDVTTRTADVIETDVECPSLSPDNRRIAYKQRRAGTLGASTWQLQVLDLETRQRITLAETRHIDDQAQWFDVENILYALRGSRVGTTDTWVVAADGSGTPRLFLPDSYSTLVVRE